MRPYVIGLAFAVVILAGGLLLPAFLPSAPRPKTVTALQQAELARRLLHAHQPSLPLVEKRSALEQLKEADLAALVERAGETLAERSREFQQLVRQAQAIDRESGMPVAELQPISASAAGVRAALTNFERFVRDSRQWLEQAVRAAQEGLRADREALGVGQIAGMVKLAAAADLLAEARQLRVELLTAQTGAFAVAADWAAVRTARDHYAGLEPARVRSQLSEDLAEIEQALAAARSEVAELTRTVSERKRTLERLRTELHTLRDERLSLQEQGFVVGDDASFETYRARYLELGQRLLELEREEQLLSLGGLRGGKLIGDDLLSGRIEGGQSVLGLAELEHRLAVATDKQQRYERARQAIIDQIKLADAVGSEAQKRLEEYTARLKALQADLEQRIAALAELAERAYAQEDAALQAARDAASAFAGAARAAQNWISAAERLQREKDPQRANERLRLIGGDEYAVAFARAGEAWAKTLIGRIHTERALGLAGYLDTLDRIEKLVPGRSFDVSSLQEALDTAREEALRVLGEARELYERLARENERKPIGVYYRSSLATVYHLLAQVDQYNAERHRSALIAELAKAVEGAERSPWLGEQVALYRVLTGGAEAAPPPQEQEAEAAPQQEQPPEPEQAPQPEQPEEEPNAP